MISFFALAGRLKHMNRWSLMRSNQVETVASHSWEVAKIAHFLTLVKNDLTGSNIDENKVTTLAVFHDVSEVVGTDCPTPIKQLNVRVSEAFKEIDRYSSSLLMNSIPVRFQAKYRPLVCDEYANKEHKLIVKSADILSALIKCKEEVDAGNNEFSSALKKTEQKLRKLNFKEVDYFLDNCLGSYQLNLDELLVKAEQAHEDN